MIADTLFGTLIFFIIEVAETASGGDMMPPSRKPSASVNPGTILLDTKAITQDVTITMIVAKLKIILRHFQKSFHEVCQAASYNNGGKKITKIISGWISIGGNTEIKLNARPPRTRTMGYEILNRCASITKKEMISSR